MELIDDLEGACIRFVHFSKENELRSRVFSEKMGLEAGWNCHISLLSEALGDDSGTKIASQPDLSGSSTHASRHSTDSLTQQRGRETGKACPSEPRERRNSAPGAISLDTAQVKFESHSRCGTADREDVEEEKQGSESEVSSIHDVHTPLIKPKSSQHPAHKELTNNSHSDSQTEATNETSTPLLKANELAPASITQTGVVTSDPVLKHEMEELQYMSEEGERMSSVESFPASSYVTENTDSMTGGLSFSNRVSGVPVKSINVVNYIVLSMCLHVDALSF